MKIVDTEDLYRLDNFTTNVCRIVYVLLASSMIIFSPIFGNQPAYAGDILLCENAEDISYYLKNNDKSEILVLSNLTLAFNDKLISNASFVETVIYKGKVAYKKSRKYECQPNSSNNLECWNNNYTGSSSGPKENDVIDMSYSILSFPNYPYLNAYDALHNKNEHSVYLKSFALTDFGSGPDVSFNSSNVNYVVCY